MVCREWCMVEIIKDQNWVNKEVFHLVHLGELLSGCQDVAHTIEDDADSLVILGGEKVAEGLQNALAAEVNNLRDLVKLVAYVQGDFVPCHHWSSL